MYTFTLDEKHFILVSLSYEDMALVYLALNVYAELIRLQKYGIVPNISSS